MKIKINNREITLPDGVSLHSSYRLLVKLAGLVDGTHYTLSWRIPRNNKSGFLWPGEDLWIEDQMEFHITAPKVRYHENVQSEG